MVHRGMVRVGHVRAAVLVALLAAFGLTSVGVAGASASEADLIATLVNQAPANAGPPGLGHNPSRTGEIPADSSRAGENAAIALPTPGSGATRSPVAESVMLDGSITANPKPFPFGYVLGGILVVLGIAGGIYGQRLRIRGRRPPRQ